MTNTRSQPSLILASFLTLILGSRVFVGAEDVPTRGEPANWPEVMSGNVISTDGEPVVGATVRFRLQKIHEYASGRWDETIETRVSQTDEQGKFTLPTSDLPKLAHRPFCTMIDVNADGFADGKWWSWYSERSTVKPDKKHLAQITLMSGRLVVGQCVDPEGNPVEGAVVRAAGAYFLQRPRVHVGWSSIETDKSGRFYLRVPDDREKTIGVWISHSDWAPEYVTVPLDDNLFEKIQMKKGGVLQGTVQRVEGTPAAGVVVTASSRFSGTIENMSFPNSIAVKTDDNGRYELPPLDGDYRIFITRSARTDHVLEPEFVVGDNPPPMIIPQLVSFQAGENQILDFVEQPKVTIQGTVRWGNDDPATGVEVRTFYMPDDFGSGVEMAKTHTNEMGQYSVEVPQGMSSLTVMVSGARNQNGKWHYAHPSENVDAERKSTQFLTLTKLVDDRSEIDWVLRETAD